MIYSIFAADKDGGIGKAGTLPWSKDGEDMRWFRSNTINHTVVMGKNTWIDPLMPKPLQDRFNVVVCNSNPHCCDAANRVISGSKLDESLRSLELKNPDRILWIIGGATLLRSTSHLIDRIYLTRFDQSYDCDVIMDLNDYLRDFKLIDEHLGENKRFQVYEKLS